MGWPDDEVAAAMIDRMSAEIAAGVFAVVLMRAVDHVAAPLADPMPGHFDIGRAARPMPPIVPLGDHDTTGKTRAQRDNDTEDDGLHLQAPSAGPATACTEPQ